MKLNVRILEMDPELASLSRTLVEMHRRELIPPSRRQAEIRARLMKSSGQTSLAVIETRIGWIGLAWSAHGLTGLQLPRKSRAQAMRDLRREDPGVVEAEPPPEMANELKDYAEGRRRSFDLRLDWSSIKPFQAMVLKAANKIPCGETRSYGWVAQQIGKPKASRAVGHALATNPIPIILPCHRVIGSDGGLHGYGGGLPMKAMLLRLEGANLNL